MMSRCAFGGQIVFAMIFCQKDAKGPKEVKRKNTLTPRFLLNQPHHYQSHLYYNQYHLQHLSNNQNPHNHHHDHRYRHHHHHHHHQAPMCGFLKDPDDNPSTGTSSHNSWDHSKYPHHRDNVHLKITFSYVLADNQSRMFF